METPHLVAQGAYGCVHRPALRCESGSHSYAHKISKILTTKEAHVELNEYVKIEKVDPLNYFHLPIPTQCTPNRDQIKSSALANCKITTDKRGPFSLLLMADGGSDLAEVLWETIDVKAFLVEVRRLFMGVELFVGNDYAHTDIKPRNIVYDAKRGRINFIDFGMMTTLDQLAADTADNKWYYYPLDFQFVQGPRGNVEPSDIIKYIADQHPRLTVTKLTQEYARVVKSVKRKGFILRSVMTFDTYQLGLTLINVLSKISHRIEPELANRLFDLFFAMMRVDLWARIDINEATKQYETIVNDYILNKKVSPIISRVLRHQSEIPTAASHTPIYDKIPSPIIKKRCPNGSRRNKQTGACVKRSSSSSSKTQKKKRCPNGSRRNKHTGACDKLDNH